MAVTSPLRRRRAYAAWVRTHAPSEPAGLCRRTSERMAEAFPELRLACGYYLDGPRDDAVPVEHWWCVAPDGEVWDATVGQFGDADGAVWRYVETTTPRGEPEPTGRCRACPNLTYDGDDVCSRACLKKSLAKGEGGSARHRQAQVGAPESKRECTRSGGTRTGRGLAADPDRGGRGSRAGRRRATGVGASAPAAGPRNTRRRSVEGARGSIEVTPRRGRQHNGNQGDDEA